MSDFQELGLTTSWNKIININISINTSCIQTSSSDGSGDLVSPGVARLILKLKGAVLLPLFFFFGGPSNLLNIVVFIKHGLHDRVNLCLFSLAVVDFLTLSFYFIFSADQMFMFNSPEMLGPVFTFIINNKITIFYSCTYGSMFLSAIIAVERCVCVLFPLHVKTILKTKYMAFIVGIGVPVISFLRLVVMAKYSVVCYFDNRTERTLMGMYVTDLFSRHKELFNFLDGIFYGFMIAVGCPIIVVIATLITSIKLWQIAVWRKHASTRTTRKEITVTKMLILLSLQFLLFNLPLVFERIYPLFNHEFVSQGKYRLFFGVWASLTESSSQMSLTFNFVIYYFASTKYRQTVHNLFRNRRRCCTNVTQTSNSVELPSVKQTCDNKRRKYQDY